MTTLISTFISFIFSIIPIIIVFCLFMRIIKAANQGEQNNQNTIRNTIHQNVNSFKNTNYDNLQSHPTDRKMIKDLINTMEDRDHDWYTQQVREEKRIKQYNDAMYRLKMDHIHEHGKY